jgi:hypothetical protein
LQRYYVSPNPPNVFGEKINQTVIFFIFMPVKMRFPLQ